MEPTLRAIELSTVISTSLSDIRHVIDRHLHFQASEARRNFRVGCRTIRRRRFYQA